MSEQYRSPTLTVAEFLDVPRLLGGEGMADMVMLPEDASVVRLVEQAPSAEVLPTSDGTPGVQWLTLGDPEGKLHVIYGPMNHLEERVGLITARQALLWERACPEDFTGMQLHIALVPSVLGRGGSVLPRFELAMHDRDVFRERAQALALLHAATQQGTRERSTRTQYEWGHSRRQRNRRTGALDVRAALLASNAAVEKKIAELETQPGHRVVADVSSHINGFGNTWVGISGPHHEFVARRLALARHMLALGPGQPVFERGWTVPLPRVPGAYRYPTAEQLTRFRSGYRGGESHGGWHIQRSREGQGRRDEPMTVLLEGSQFAALPDALDENMTFADMTAQNWNGWQRELVAYMHSLVPLVKSFMRGNNIMVREMLAALGVDHGWGSEAVADEKAPVSSEMYSAFVLQLPVMMAGRCGQLVDFFNAVQLEDEAKEAENWRSRLVHESWGQGRFVAIPPAYSVGFELIALQQVMRHCAGLYGVGGGLPMLDFRNELNSLDDDTVRGGLLNGYPRMGISRADHLAVRGYVKVFDDFELGPPLTQIDRFMLGMSAEDAGQLTALQGCEWPRL